MYTNFDSKFVIGLTGPIGSGKDTTAEIMQSVLGLPSIVTAFGHPIKLAAKLLFRLSEYDVNDREGKERYNEYWGMTSRDIQRKIGTECMRNVFGEDHLVKLLYANLCHSKEQVVIISDVRFPNEVDFCRKHGVLVHIQRPENPYIQFMSDHPSDAGAEIHKDDLVLKNTGRKYDLRCNILAMLRGALGTKIDNKLFVKAQC